MLYFNRKVECTILLGNSSTVRIKEIIRHGWIDYNSSIVGNSKGTTKYTF